jgi:hypothetical protein
MTQRLTADDAARFARSTVAHATREYPNRLDHVLLGDADLRSPRSLHPAFYGSFDWHSCVEGYWLLARLLRRFSAFAERASVVALLNAQLTPENLAGEVVYAREPAHAGFERPYGWAWLLMLAAELARSGFEEAAPWRRVLEPLAEVFVDRFMTFLPKATYPVRAGTHGNTAFSLALVHEYAQVCSRNELAAAVARASREWYRDDADAQVWEPSGNDFLSPALCEAVCMQRVLPAGEFADWFATFLPRLEFGEPVALFRPAVPSDRADGQIAHLDGLNLSRAWCWRLLAQTAENDALAARMRSAAAVHLNASLPHLADDYMGEHWLAVYAVLALDV